MKTPLLNSWEFLDSTEFLEACDNGDEPGTCQPDIHSSFTSDKQKQRDILLLDGLINS